MTGFSFKPAEFKPSSLTIGFCGETGKGKTYSALRLATGLANGGRIVVIDTERGRAQRYATEFKFDVCELTEPFTPNRYVEAIKAAYALNPAVIIIDSATHEWTGEGGCLEWHAQITENMANKWGGSPEKFNFQAWGDVKQSHRHFIRCFEAPKCHMLCTFRAKEKNEQIKENGKTKIVNKGLRPEGSEDLPFALDILMTFEDAAGVPSFGAKTLSHIFNGIFKEGERISKEHGQRLVAWCCQGKNPPKQEPIQDLSEDETNKIISQSRDEAAKGMNAYKEYWASLDKSQQKALAPYHDGNKKMAHEVDILNVKGGE